MPSHSRTLAIITAALAAAVLYPSTAHAYVGPGAGFAVVGSLAVVFITFFLALGSLISWPFRAIRRAIRSRHLRGPAEIRRAIVLGLDGLDPVLTKRFMDEGLLPNFKKLADEGSFKPLQTACPSMSPVAWSTFATGVDASRHNIFDFLGRDEKTYFPILSSTRISNPEKSIKLGKFTIPIGKPSIRLMRKSKTFWKVLDDCYVPCHVLRVPITFPPEKMKNGVILSAMCTPDLRGSQGSFTMFTTDSERVGAYTGGTLLLVERDGDTIRGEIPGPPSPFKPEAGEMTVSFTATIDESGETVSFDFGGNEVTLSAKDYSEWLTIEFNAGLGVKVKGIVKLYVTQISPHFELYVTPINLDPNSPAMPISDPSMFSQYLAKLQGSYATLGLAEDTWALNERMIDESAFLEQTYAIHEEREKMFFNSLKKNRSGLTVVVFDSTDRIQHMFMRYMDPSNPANRDKDTTLHAKAIEELYVKMDGLLARVMEHVDDKTLLCVVSDHGFKQFKRGVNINTWALENGYMKAKGGEAGGNGADGAVAGGNGADGAVAGGNGADGAVAGGNGADGAVAGDPAAGRAEAPGVAESPDGEACDFGGYCAGVAGSGSAIGEYLRGVDWSHTKIYQLGLSGIYINKKGRESHGLVKSDEYKALKREIVEKLEGLRDPDTGEVAITSVYDTKEIMSGPYADGAPDLIIGYNVGYRASWDAAVGKSSEAVLEDNLKSWSGDHCIDYKLVPGVLFTNRKVVADRPGLIDMGPSILDLFGVKIPDFMMGQSIFRGGGAGDAAGDGPAQNDRSPDQVRAREDR